MSVHYDISPILSPFFKRYYLSIARNFDIFHINGINTYTALSLNKCISFLIIIAKYLEILFTILFFY